MKSLKNKKTRVKSKLHLRKKHKNHRKTHKVGAGRVGKFFKSLSPFKGQQKTGTQEQPTGPVATKVPQVNKPQLSANTRNSNKTQKSPLTVNQGEVVYNSRIVTTTPTTPSKNSSHLYATVGVKTQTHEQLAKSQFANYRSSSTPQVSNQSHYETVEGADNQSLLPLYATTGTTPHTTSTEYAVAKHVLNPLANLPTLMEAMHGNQLYFNNNKRARGQKQPLYEVIEPDTRPNGLIGPGLNNYNKRKASLDLLKTVIDCIYYTIGLQNNKEKEYGLPYIIKKLDEHYTLENIDLFLNAFSEKASELGYKGDNCEVPELITFLKDYQMESKMKSNNGKYKEVYVMSLFTPNETPGLQRRYAVVNRTTRTPRTPVKKPNNVSYTTSLNFTNQIPKGTTPSQGNPVTYAQIKHASQSNEPVYQTVVQAQAAPRNLYQTVEQAMSGNSNESSTNGNQYIPNPMGHNRPTTIATESVSLKPSLTPIDLKCGKILKKGDSGYTNQQACLLEQAQFERLRQEKIEEKNPIFYGALWKNLNPSLIGTSLGKKVNALKTKDCFNKEKNKGINTMTCNRIKRELTPKLCGESKWLGDEKKAYTLCKNLVDTYYTTPNSIKQNSKKGTNSTA